nr:D170 [uncultured bacterium]
MKPRISIITLGVTDLDRARRFYVDGLGLAVRPESVDGDVIFIEMGTVWLCLWESTKLAADAGVVEEGTGFRRIAIAHNVATREEVDGVIEQVSAAGGAIIKAPHETFYGGYGAYFADPDAFLWEVAWNPGMPFLAD